MRGAPLRALAPARVGRLLVALVALAGCTSTTDVGDGGVVPDVPTIEGGTIRPDATAEDAAGPDGSRADAGPSCPGACDPRVARSCSGTASCTLGIGLPMCVPALGAGARGDACSSPDECGAGLGCFRDRATGLGSCERACCPLDGAGCEPTERCGGAGELVGGERTAWGQCGPVRSCDVLAPVACTEREGCFIVDPSGATECRLAGLAAAGEACERPEDCAAGLFCGGLGPRTCLVVCELAAARACPDLSRCVAQSYSPAGTGVCVREPGAP